jgi:hypothetical protein
MAVNFSSGKQRFNRQHPCPVCGGDDSDRRGAGRRCFGFLSSDGEYAHCTREEYAGAIPMTDGSQTYAHKMHGECRCGVTHAPAPIAAAGPGPKKHIVATYDYLSAEKRLLFQVVRLEPKSFRQRRPDGLGSWIWDLEGVSPVLYRLPELLAAPKDLPVYVPEGEKDVEALRSRGIVATCNPMGAGKWRASYNEALRGRQVVIIRDKDGPGRKHAEEVAWYLNGIAATLRIIEAPGPGKDVSDYFEQGGTRKQLEALAASAPAWQAAAGPTPESAPPRLKTKSLREICATDYPEPRMLVPGLLQQGVVTLLAGKPKLGKSFWVLGGAFAIAEAAMAFGEIQCEQSAVLYLALEDTERRVKGRALKMLAGQSVPEYIDVATDCPRADEGLVDLLDLYFNEHPTCKLVIVDTLAKIKPPRTRNGDLYADDYLSLQAFIDLAHRRDVAVLLVTHCRKADGSDITDDVMGTTGVSGAAENILVMRHTRQDEERATLHVTGKDLESQTLTMQFQKETCTWRILGDAKEYAQTREQQEILEVLKALGGEATPKQVSELADKNHNATKSIMWRMHQNGLLSVDQGGVYRHSAASKEAPPTPAETDATRATAASSVDEDQEPTQARAATSSDMEYLRSEVLKQWEERKWRQVFLDGFPRGGSSFTAQKYIEHSTTVAALQALLRAVLALEVR